VGKTQVQKSLNNLVANGQITQKAYGKQVVFVVKQDDTDRPSQQELDKMDSAISELKATLAEVKEEFKEFSGTLAKLRSSMTVDELNQRIKQLLLEVREEIAIYD
jgi:DNA repair ATPase RecN